MRSIIEIRSGVLRLILALMVVVMHTTGIRWGDLAVWLFFMTSGYWIARMWEVEYLRTRRPWLTFLVSRSWRVLPIYWLCYALTIGVCWLTARHGREVWAEVLNAEWLTRGIIVISSSSQMLLMRPAWSLDIEMQFYLMTPLMMALITKFRSSHVCVLVSWGVLLVSIAGFGDYFFPQTLLPYSLLFLIGILAWVLQWRPTVLLAKLSGWLFFSSLAFVLVWWFLGKVGVGGIGLPGNSVSRDSVFFVLAVPFFIHSCQQKSDVLDRHLGNLAYPLYLVHDAWDILFEQMLKEKSNLLKAGSLPLQWALMLGSAFVLYWFFDRTIESRRRMFVSSRLN